MLLFFPLLVLSTFPFFSLGISLFLSSAGLKTASPALLPHATPAFSFFLLAHSFVYVVVLLYCLFVSGALLEKYLGTASGTRFLDPHLLTLLFVFSISISMNSACVVFSTCVRLVPCVFLSLFLLLLDVLHVVSIVELRGKFRT